MWLIVRQLPIKAGWRDYFLWCSGILAEAICSKFLLELTILILQTKFVQKGYLQSKTEKVNTTTEFCIFKLVKFHPKLATFDCLDQICPKEVFPVKNRKSQQHHWILHIQVHLGAIFFGAMELLGQSRESWPSMALLGHMQNLETKMLWHF